MTSARLIDNIVNEKGLGREEWERRSRANYIKLAGTAGAILSLSLGVMAYNAMGYLDLNKRLQRIPAFSEEIDLREERAKIISSQQKYLDSMLYSTLGGVSLSALCTIPSLITSRKIGSNVWETNSRRRNQ